MPRGYPDTVTCQECGEGWPSDFAHCPSCGARLPMPGEKKSKNPKVDPLIQEGRNQVLYLMLVIGDENVAHDNYHPDVAEHLLETRREIVKRLKHPREDGLGVVNTFWPRKTDWPDFEKYTYRPG